MNDRTLLNFKCILLSFQTVYGLNINFVKFELVKLDDRRDTNRLVRIMGCRIGDLSNKYLELLLGAKYKDVVT